MTVAASPTLGAPGLYFVPQTPRRGLRDVPMDVCAFAGVAPRGPARVPLPDEGRRREGQPGAPGDPRRRSVPVPVTSFDEYTRLYGRFEGPGRLPYAVASFFEQGGRKAYVVRIVPDDAGTGRGPDVASGLLDPIGVIGAPGPVRLWARSEGRWGAGLSVRLAFSTRPVPLRPGHSPAELTAPPELSLPVGSLLRMRLDTGARVLGFVTAARLEGEPFDHVRRRALTLDAPPPGNVESVEVVEAGVDVDDGDGRSEHFESLGLSADHPCWVARELAAASELVEPDESWWSASLLPDTAALPPAGARLSGGADSYPRITPDDFFDPDWAPGDEEPRSGVHSVLDVADVAMVVAPDLYEPRPVTPMEPIVSPRSLAGREFAECIDPPPPPEQEAPPPGLDLLALDPTVGSDRERIVGYQLRLQQLAETMRSITVLLDVPPRLGQRDILRWRARFDSAFVAAFHPWLWVARPGGGGSAVEVNPAAVAAGIVARRELRDGVQFGPANELAARVVDVLDPVSLERHGELHWANVNVFAPERDGVRLTAARTLSTGRDYRQLSVRRLVTMLCRVLEREMAWVVFEPHTESLRADLRHQIDAYLRSLFRANAFAGATEQEAFFVRCDDSINPPQLVDAGQLHVDIGVAPAEPLEFIVVRLSRDGDGTLLAEDAGA